jgi:hypothetical protein
MPRLVSVLVTIASLACTHSAPPRPKYLPIAQTTAPQVDWALTAIDDNPALPAHIWNFCSRNGPDQAEATWTPSRADVEDLEARLPLVMEAQGLSLPLVQYCRVYHGLVRGGRRFIYVNAGDCALGMPGTYEVCDGGAAFWGIEYDVEKKAFTVLEANGEI